MGVPRKNRYSRFGRWFLLVLALCFASFGYHLYSRWELKRQSAKLLSELPSAPVRRADIRSTMLAGGKTDSAEKTIIECELERIEMRSENKTFFGSGASTILTVIPDGSFVKKGDVLCTLDASEYEEFVRLQEIKNERARSDLLQAKLNFESAQMTLHEFQQGLMTQTSQYQDGVIALRRSDLTRANDRLAWSERMLEKGYVSADQVSTAKQTVRQAELGLLQSNWDKKLFDQFGAPRQIKILSSRIESARATLINETIRMERFEERLAYYKKMVELCTIRAPQDGMVIYANDDGRQVRIEPGMEVRQRQDLFYLPDISKMEVVTYLHESVANRVRPGMRVRTRISALANRELEGVVSKIGPLPFMPERLSENKFFAATVRLDSVPETIRPEMTAEVEIALVSQENALAIPAEAVSYEKGQAFCYVVKPDGLERRELSIGLSNRDLMEVRDGLDEGEEVLFEAKNAESLSALVYESPLNDQLDIKPIARLEEAPAPSGEEAGTAPRSGIIGTSAASGL